MRHRQPANLWGWRARASQWRRYMGMRRETWRPRRACWPALVAALLLLGTMPALQGTAQAAAASAAGGPNTWSLTGSMTTARESATATLLPNGKVLIAGGDNVGSAELYDPSTGTFTPTGSMSTARSGQTATLLPNGKVLIAGGCTEYNCFNNTNLASAELYDPATGTFTMTGSMTTARANHTATLLPNGKVLIAGGCCTGYGQPFGSAELYDPSTGTFTSTGNMTTPRSGQTATLLPNGKVLVAGGSNNIVLSSAELYDPGTGTWTATGSMATTRQDHTATLLSNGKVLIAGGFDYTSGDHASAELYDPATGTWTTTGDMATARREQTATLLPNGQVLVAGGVSCNAYPCTTFASAEIYDPAAGSWASTGDMTAARQRHTATLLPNGMVLVAGGENCNAYPCTDFASAELYSAGPGPLAAVSSHSLSFGWQTVSTSSATQSITVTNVGSLPLTVSSVVTAGANAADFPVVTDCTAAPIAPAGNCTIAVRFTPAAIGARSANLSITDDAPSSPQTVSLSGYGTGPNTWSPTGSMTTARYHHTATLLLNGKVLVTGGCCTGYSQPLASAELYDPATGTFTATGSMGTARSNHTATLFTSGPLKGKVLVAGGQGPCTSSCPGPILVSAELYDPATGTFTATGSMHIARSGHTATLLPGGKVLIAGGDIFGSAELYDPSTGTFTPVGRMTTYRSGHTATLLPNGQVLIAGGAGSEGTSLASAELYDPSTGAFTATGSMTTPRQGHTATLLPNGKVLVAGGCDESPTDYGCPNTLSSAELYDPATGTFTATGSMSAARQYHTATLLPTGQVLVAGGATCTASVCSESSAELYDPGMGIWTTTSSMITGSEWDTATLLPTDHVLVAGGCTAVKGCADSSAELYDASPGPLIVVSPQTLDFGAQVGGTTSATQGVTVTNTGYQPLAVSSVAITGANPGDFTSTDTCRGAPIAPQSSCLIAVRFTPSALGFSGASLSIASNAPTGVQTVVMSGTGIDPAVPVGLSPAGLTFGPQLVGTGSPTQPVTITNLRFLPLDISSVTFSGANPADFSATSSCNGVTLALTASCTVLVGFTPTAVGSRSANLTVSDDASNSPQSIPVSGTATVTNPRVVGSGTPASCTDVALNSALSYGGYISFNCGAAPVTITLSMTQTVALSATLDGRGQQVTISGNSAVQVFHVNAGVHVTLDDLTIANGLAAQGGGLYNAGVTAVIDSTFTANSAAGVAGANGAPGGDGDGGALYNNGAMTVISSTFTGNSATGGYGGGSFSASGAAGGNGYGGGLYNGGTISVTSSTLSANSASGGYGGGGSYGGPGDGGPGYAGGTGAGGGLFSAGATVVSDSTFSGDSAAGGSGGGGGYGGNNGGLGGYGGNGYGGAVYSGGGAVPLVNSTLSGNSATGGTGGPGYFDGNGGNGYGGGVFSSGGAAALTADTLAGNSAAAGAGGYGGFGTANGTPGTATAASLDGARPITLTTSIVAMSGVTPGVPDCAGVIADGGHNLQFGDNSCGSSILTGDPLLGPLQDNGGPTPTLAVLPGSPAIDAVPAASCTLRSDQRGQPRPDEPADNGACDVGAFEYQASSDPVGLTPPALSFGARLVGSSATQSITVTNRGTIPLTITTTGMSGADPGDFITTGTCGGVTLAPAGACTLQARFSPVAVGARNAILTLTDSAPTSPQQVPLSGTAYVLNPRVVGSGTPASCTQLALHDALALGGHIGFNCGSAPVTITLSLTQTIARNATLDGRGQQVAISGDHTVQVFHVDHGVQFTLDHLTVADGLATQGGGLYNDGGSVTILDSTFTHNAALGIVGDGYTTPTVEGAGGGLYSAGGTVTVRQSLFNANSATGGLGLSSSPPCCPGTPTGGPAGGGALFNAGGTMIVSSSVITANSTVGGAGTSNSLESFGGAGGIATGGGVYNAATLVMSGTLLNGNSAAGGAGGAGDTSGNSLYSASGGHGGRGRGGGLYNAGTVTMILSTITANSAAGGMGGAGGYPGRSGNGGNGGTGGDSSGGSIYSSGSTTVLSSTVGGNSAGGGAGGVGNSGNNGGGGGFGGYAYGGGMYASAGAMTLTGDTLSGNSARGGNGGDGGGGSDGGNDSGGVGGFGGDGNGGALYTAGGGARLNTSTLSGNSASGGNGGNGGEPFIPGSGGYGGNGGTGCGGGVYGSGSGIYNCGGETQGVVTQLTGSTLAGNSASGGLGGSPRGPGYGLPGSAMGVSIFDPFTPTAAITLTTSIISGTASDCAGAIGDGGHNLQYGDNGCGSGIPVANPLLGPLRNNGGPTPTMALLAGSAAIDAVPAAACTLHSDQRGQPRPDEPADNGACDIGAYESQSVAGRSQGTAARSQSAAAKPQGVAARSVPRGHRRGLTLIPHEHHDRARNPLGPLTGPARVHCPGQMPGSSALVVAMTEPPGPLRAASAVPRPHGEEQFSTGGPHETSPRSVLSPQNHRGRDGARPLTRRHDRRRDHALRRPSRRG